MADLDEPTKFMRIGEGAVGPSEEVSPGEYLRSAKGLLAKGRQREAYDLLQAALVKYDDDPFLLSYSGYLSACVAGKYRNGIESCARAITLFEKKLACADEGVENKINAVLHLNLGRAYIAGGKKKAGVEILYKGLRFDKQNRDLLMEVKKLGIRKIVPVVFLDRSNPINALLGKMLRKKEKQTTQERRQT